MWEIPHQILLDLGHAVLYPLLPLTKGGATCKIVTYMLDLLSGEHHRDFALIGYAFATRTFQLLKQDRGYFITRNLLPTDEQGRVLGNG